MMIAGINDFASLERMIASFEEKSRSNAILTDEKVKADIITMNLYNEVEFSRSQVYCILVLKLFFKP